MPGLHCKSLQPGRDTKAELNRRSQVCETLAGTGVRIAKVSPSALYLASGHYFDRAGFLLAGQIHLGNGRASGYRALYSGLEDRRVSLNTYARRNGINRRCWMFQKAQQSIHDDSG